MPHREWMQAIYDSLDKQVDEAKYTNPAIQVLFEVIENDKITPEERARMKEEDNQAELETQAFKEGEEKGWNAGKDEGRLEGKLEGRLEGRMAEKEETARNLMALGTLTEEQIASATGLSLEAVKALSTRVWE